MDGLLVVQVAAVEVLPLDQTKTVLLQSVERVVVQAETLLELGEGWVETVFLV